MRQRQAGGIGGRGHGSPHLSPLPPKQRHRAGTDGARLAVPRSAFRIPRWTQPSPGDLARKAQSVEPQRIVIGDPGGEDVGLPGPGRQLEAIEQVQHCRQTLRAGGARLLRHALPAQQEAQEVRRGHRLDLTPQPVQRVAVNPGQQPSLAPLEDAS